MGQASCVIDGYYYLHTNGDLIYKPHDAGRIGDFMESDMVRAFWPVDDSDRATAWTIVVEATAAGARKDRVRELAEKWGCTDDDAEVYVREVLNGTVALRPDGNMMSAVRADFVNLMESPIGFGTTAYEALAELAVALGYRPQKQWGVSFADLVTDRDRSVSP